MGADPGWWQLLLSRLFLRIPLPGRGPYLSPAGWGTRQRRKGPGGRGQAGAEGASPAIGPFHLLRAARAEELLAKANFSPDNCHYY